MRYNYVCQKIIKSVDFFQATIDNIGDVFSRFCIF